MLPAGTFLPLDRLYLLSTRKVVGNGIIRSLTMITRAVGDPYWANVSARLRHVVSSDLGY